jgi:hypothetical protein
LEISPTYYISDLAGNRMTESFSFDFFILKGDLNRDRIVSTSDFLTLSSNFGKTNATYADGDVNYDGQVTIADFIDLSSNFSKFLPPPAPAAPAQAPAAAEITASAIPLTAVLDQTGEESVIGKTSSTSIIRRSARHHHQRRRLASFMSK